MKVPRRITNLSSSPVILHYALPILMAYLTIGTIAQKYIGLYEATKIFFANPILWAGPIPLPGMPIIIALIFINLSAKLIFKSPWKPEKIGIIITHIGAILLMVGGLFTALFSSESYMDLTLNEPKNTITDYHERKFVILDSQKNIIFGKNQHHLSANQIINLPTHGITLTILETCRNCEIKKRIGATENHKGMAQHMMLTSKNLEHNNEENMSGITFAIKTTENEEIQTVLEDIPQNPQITINKKTYTFALRKKQRTLPFKVELLDFKRQAYPGTNLAKSYESDVRITDGNLTWDSKISMNNPLRYKGYTFFQSSFIETTQGQISVLAVVWNAGRSFPYISGLIMCLGMIVHLLQRKNHKTNPTENNPSTIKPFPRM